MAFWFRGPLLSPSTFAPAAIVFVAAVLFTSVAAHAQATTETASQSLRIRPFATYSRVDTDYGGTNNGATVGVDLDFKVPHLYGIRPGLDVREVFSSGDVVNERSFSGGPQIVFNAGRYHPYADFLIGAGTITFPHPTIPGYTHDNSTVYSFGGGIDVSVTQSWAVRVDYMRQHWKLESDLPAFYPSQLSFGLRYQLHLRNKYGPE